MSAPEPLPAPTTALRITGRDALDLLHRISSNALLDLAAGEARPTLFCDFRGRLLHRAAVARARDGALWLLRSDAGGAELAAFLDRHVFREDVKIEDRSSELPLQIAFSGRRPPLYEEGPDGVPSRVGLPCGETFSHRGSAGAAHDAARAAADRVRHARPCHGHEIAPDFHPFEVALGDEVHLDKGCFTGQEALQRLITYGSVRRGLAILSGSGTPPSPRSEVASSGRAAGPITSVAVEESGGWIALAVLPLELRNGGAALETPAGAPDTWRFVESPRPLGRP